MRTWAPPPVITRSRVIAPLSTIVWPLTVTETFVADAATGTWAPLLIVTVNVPEICTAGKAEVTVPTTSAVTPFASSVSATDGSAIVNSAST